MSSWLKALQRVFGDRVEDALEGTPLSPLGEKHNFGLYVVRNAITADYAEKLLLQSKQALRDIAARHCRGTPKQSFMTQCKHVLGVVGASTAMMARAGMIVMDWSKCQPLTISINILMKKPLSPAIRCSMKLL